MTGNKASILEFLRNKTKGSVIPLFDTVWLEDWSRNKNKITTGLQGVFFQKEIIVRSSSSDEDIDLKSTVGKYQSIVLKNSSKSELQKAINSVFRSIVKQEGAVSNHRVIVQEYISNTVYHGVLLSRYLSPESPYYLLNMVETESGTDSVTSGLTIPQRIYIHDSIDPGYLKKKSHHIYRLYKAVKELESFFPDRSMDIEFGIDQFSVVHLFQLRFINSGKKERDLQRIDITKKISREFHRMQRVKNNPLSNMTDWNPAEMIGFLPPALPFSLYKHLITDQTWYKARKVIGYNKNIKGPLMVNVCGHAFIDIQQSLSSFLPNDISKSAKEKIVSYGIKMVLENPSLHDKIEFELTLSSFSFTLHKRIQKIGGNTIHRQDQDKIAVALKNILEKGVNGISKGSLAYSVAKIKKLEEYSFTEHYSVLNKKAQVSNVIQLLKLAKEAAFHFAVIARYSFIAETLLRDLSDLQIISPQAISTYKSSFHTIEREMFDALSQTAQGKKTVKHFVKKFGHLRPGTYDLNQPPISKMVKILLKKHPVYQSPALPANPFKFPKTVYDQVDQLLQKNDMLINAESLTGFIEEAISKREYGKFVYSKFVSAILNIMQVWGRKQGLEKISLEHININDFILFYNKEISISEFKKRVNQNRKLHQINKNILLPSFLTAAEEIFFSTELTSRPNFITSKIATGETYIISGASGSASLNGKIILIERADPGYDYIFTQKISGIITKYGGSNSHLSLRCHELGIPAAIGCGKLYDELLKLPVITLNCKDQKFEHVYWNKFKK